MITTPSISDDAKVNAVIVLLDELLMVIAHENERLSAGLPASLAQSVARKTQLSGSFEAFLLGMRRGEIDVAAALPATHQELVVRLEALRPLMDENMTLIRSAMLATRRRIDAIMQALRQTQSPSQGYGADSRVRQKADARGSQWA